MDENDKNALVGGAVSARDAGDVLEYSWTDLGTLDTVSDRRQGPVQP